MTDHLMRLYDQVVSGLVSRWDSIYPTILRVVAVFFVAALFWVVFKRILKRVRKRVQKYEFVRDNDGIFRLVERAVRYAVGFICGIYIINLLEIPIIERIFYAALILLVAVPVKDFVLLLLTYLENNLAKKTKGKVDDIIFDLLNRFSGVVIFAVAVLLSLDVLGVNVLPFVAGAGVAGIAIGFAAKDTLSNLIAGVLLIIDRPFEVGDRIEIWSAPKNSATWGDVIDIGLRATKIRTTDNIVIVIPNNEIMMRDIINYTTISTEIRVRIPIGISYDADVKKAKAVILDVAKRPDWVCDSPAPQVVVKQFGESSVDLELRVWIKDARKRIHTISFMTDNVKEAFDREGIEIPYPKRDIKIIQQEQSG